MDCGFYAPACPLLLETQVTGLCVLLLAGVALAGLVLAFRRRLWRARGGQIASMLVLTVSLATLAGLVTVSAAESFQVHTDLPGKGPPSYFEIWYNQASQHQVASLVPLVGVLVVATLLTCWAVATSLRPTEAERKAARP